MATEKVIDDFCRITMSEKKERPIIVVRSSDRWSRYAAEAMRLCAHLQVEGFADAVANLADAVWIEAERRDRADAEKNP